MHLVTLCSGIRFGAVRQRRGIGGLLAVRAGGRRLGAAAVQAAPRAAWLLLILPVVAHRQLHEAM